ncbi:hypothetical protein [Labilithrix luteola]|nr:hypothetical protein [Labilithrix luteola]
MRTVLAVVTSGAIVVACSSFGTSESNVPESSGSDASADSSDVASPADGGGDAADGTTSGPFCSGPPVATAFCASFDEGNPASFDWNGPPDINGKAGLEVIANAPGTPSAPGALRATVEPSATNDCLGRAELSKTISASRPINKVHAEFMTKVDLVSSRFSYVHLTANSASDTGGSWQVGLSHADSVSDYSEIWNPPVGQQVGLGQGPPFSRYLLTGRWTKVAIDMTISPPHFDVSFDDVPVASRDSAVVKELTAQGATLAIGPLIGVCPSNTEVWFDNVRLSVE